MNNTNTRYIRRASMHAIQQQVPTSENLILSETSGRGFTEALFVALLSSYQNNIHLHLAGREWKIGMERKLLSHMNMLFL